MMHLARVVELYIRSTQRERKKAGGNRVLLVFSFEGMHEFPEYDLPLSN